MVWIGCTHMPMVSIVISVTLVKHVLVLSIAKTTFIAKTIFILIKVRRIGGLFQNLVVIQSQLTVSAVIHDTRMVVTISAVLSPVCIKHVTTRIG